MDYELKNFELRDEIRVLKRQLSVEKSKTSLFTQLQKINNSREVASFFAIRNHEFLVITLDLRLHCKTKIKRLTFCLYEGSNLTTNLGSVEFDVIYDCVSGDFKHLSIAEFLMKTNSKSKGYGSLLLAEALCHIEQTFGKTTKIIGWLSSVDERDRNNHQRRNHVYQKFGFNIDGDIVTLKEIDLSFIHKEKDKWKN